MFLLYGGLFFLLLGRFVFIQVTGTADGQVLSARAESKYNREQLIQANRGKIVDRNGEVIVEDTLSYKIIAVISPKATSNSNNPRHVTDPEKTAQVLSKYIDMSEQEIVNLLNKNIKNGKTYQVEFGKSGRDISYKKMMEIKEYKLPGIIFIQDMKRLYPNGQFASHLIGFALKEEKDDGKAVAVGKMGLEYIYDKELTGTPGKVEFKGDTKGFLLPNAEKMITKPQDGDTIYLTIDKTIQNFLEDALNKAQEKYNPEKMTAIVANPKTGEILAMSQRPTFEPNTRDGLSTNWLNEAIEQTIEPGSTMKIFTLASAIEEGVWQPNATYKSGSYTVYDRTIRDHNVYGWGTITFLEGFQRSSNVSMAYLLNRIGDETFIEYIHRFGFGEKTGIDLPHEASGTVSDQYPINRVTTTYGQGTTVTPVQLIQGMTSIANKGKMMQPYVIDKIVNPNTGEVITDHKPTEKKSPISAKTADQVKEILASTVTSEHGTAKRFKLNEYTTAGKTGTAQIAKPGGGYYWGSNFFLYSFLGMAPVEDPKLIVYVAVHKPQLEGSEVGSEPTSEIFKSVVENSLKYLNIQPENLELASPIKMPNVVGKNVIESQSLLESQGLKTVIIGQEEQVREQFPAEGTSMLASGSVFVKGDGEIQLPNFSGWSKRNLMIYKSLSKVPIEIVGEGFVTSQSLTAGSAVSVNTPVVVHLSTPKELETQSEVKQNMETSSQD